MELLFSPYTLVKKNNQGVQKGSLIRVSDGENFGVADLCPKVELGDSNLLDQITKNGSLFLRAQQLAYEDLSARKNKKSLLLDKPVKNNFLITDYQKLILSDLKSLQGRFGSLSIKIKGDKDIKSLLTYLNSNFAEPTLDCKLRLDFNAKLSPTEFEFFLNSLSELIVNKIEYIEDPTIISPEWAIWNQRVPLAIDFQKTENSDYFKYKILKPAREFVPENLNNFTLTSAMDHPVGVAHGLSLAQKMSQNDSGFLTLDLYEDCGFNKYYNQDELFLNFSKLALNDFGIGMTEEIKKLNWVTLDRMSN